MIVETWKPVVGFEGVYEVSDHGRVRSLPRIAEYERVDQYSGRILTIRRKHAGKLLRPGRKPSGHVSVALGRGNSVDVHLIVLNAFVGACPIGCEGLHENDTPDDNRIGNLSWGTRSQNVRDAIRNGKFPLGSRHHMAKLTETQVGEIKRDLPLRSTDRIAAAYGVSGAAIRQIKRGKTWKNVEVSA